jgi:hypothetical protein
MLSINVLMSLGESTSLSQYTHFILDIKYFLYTSLAVKAGESGIAKYTTLKNNFRRFYNTGFYVLNKLERFSAGSLVSVA